jgi:hypothetical protein
VTTEAAGAVGGAAINGVVGAVTGAAEGVQRGIGKGSHSTPAAALTLGALGVTGLLEWPVVMVIGGGALVLRQLNKNGHSDGSHKATLTSVKAAPTKSTSSASPRKSPAKRAPARSRGTQSRARR